MTNFKWIGPKIECYNPVLKDDHFEFYRSFIYNDEQFEVGESALFSEGNGSRMPRIGRILCAYYSPKQEDKYRGLVQWYSWPATINRELNVTNIKFDYKNEVVEDETYDEVTSNTMVSLQDIKRKCIVFYASDLDPPNLIKMNNLNPDIYFSCRYKIECNRLVPAFSNKCIRNLFGEDYFLANALKHKLDINEFYTENDLTFITQCSPLIKTTPKYKHGSNCLKTPMANLDFEEKNVNNIKSPLNPSNHLRLTPQNERFSLSLKRNSSVKRVLNDSFGDSPTSPSGIPILSYSIIKSTYDNSEGIKMKLRLTESECGTNLKVFPTRLNKEVVNMKSPIKLSDIKKVNNCIEISSDIVNNSDSQMSVQTRSSKTPAKIDSTRRRSSRTVEKKSYSEYSPPEQSTPLKRKRRPSHSSGINTPLSEIRICLSKIYEDQGLPKKYLDDNFVNGNSSPKRKSEVDNHKELDNVSTNFKKKCLGKFNDTSTKKDNSDKELFCSSPRLRRNVKGNNTLSSSPKDTAERSLKYVTNNPGDTDNNNSPNKSPKLSDRPKRSASRPKRFTDVIDKNMFSKTPPNTPRNSNKQLNDDDTDKKSRSVNLRKNALMNSCKKLTYDDSDDEEIFMPKTPKRNTLKTNIKTPTKSTPRSASSRAKMIKEGIITPSVQAREIALRKDNTPLSKARTQLHVSYVPNSLPCREKEFTDIISFLKGKLLDGCGGCMYISGVPGTGKTATVTEVIRMLQEAAEKGEIPSFTYVNINGMKLSEPRQAYVEIVKQIAGKTLHWEQAQTMLENKFIKPQKKSSSIILMVDELDILCTKRQDVVYNLLDWPTKANTQLIVVTIANTMDLPERLLMGRVTSRLGLTRLPFQPYSHKQLQEIVQKRLSGIHAFNPDAVQLVARKVASVSGDARRALDICRRAVEIAELEGKHNLVSLPHVNQALNAMITQPKVRAIRNCSRLEKLILQAVVAEVERTGVEETTFSHIFKMLVTLASLDGFKMVSTTIAMASVNRLGLCRLLLIDQKCSHIHQKIILNVSVDDVYYALTKTDI